MPSVIPFVPRPKKPPSASARSIPQSPVLKLAYLDKSGHTHYATLSASSRLVSVSDDPVAGEIMLQALGNALAVCGARLISAHSTMGLFIDLEVPSDEEVMRCGT